MAGTKAETEAASSADQLRSAAQRATRQGRGDEAVRLLAEAAALAPRSALVHYELGVALAMLGRNQTAGRALRRAAALLPASFQTVYNLAVVDRRCGRVPAAVEGYRRAARLRPELPDAPRALATILTDLGRAEEAVAVLRAALGRRPGDGELLLRLGLALRRAGRSRQATAAFRAASIADPGNAEAWAQSGIDFKQDDRTAEAGVCFQRALILRPAFASAAFGLCMSRLPRFYDRVGEIEAVRADYETGLVALEAAIRLDSPAALEAAAGAVGSFQPYYLAYQERCDRDLQERYGRLLVRIMAACHPLPAPAPAAGGPIRVGMVCGFFRWHTIWKLLARGWAEGLDRRRFQVFGYSTGAIRDAETAAAAACFDRFHPGPHSVRDWIQAIRADAPQVLIYPEIGMDAMTVQLAALRLAPVQCVSWGHPETTGLPTIDYFLSSDLMEPPGAEAHYSERLVRLAHLGIRYRPPAVPEGCLELSRFGIGPEAVLYLCCQYLSKYLPQYDQVFARIAAAVPEARFLFIDPRSPARTRRLRQRLAAAFAAEGLEAERHLVILPYLEPPQYAALNRTADVYLDSIGWSGGNTTMEAVAAGLPVVTLPGALMRGRHSYAILRLMGLEETIAADLDEYVAIAVRLGRDRDWRRRVAARVVAGQERLFGDEAGLRDLEAFLERVVTTIGGS
jgi:predicted O-linked N-acetylglucosamine transferase (SPINDLY family)